MTTNETPANYQRSLDRAHAEHCRISAEGRYPATGARFWTVLNPTNGHEYVVTQSGHALVCGCPARDYCKHRALVHEALTAEAIAEATPHHNWLHAMAMRRARD